jgi:hypothetical protein
MSTEGFQHGRAGEADIDRLLAGERTGAISDAERAELEARVRADPALARELADQRALAAAIARVTPVPGRPQAEMQLARARAELARQKGRAWRAWGAAAAVLLALGLALLFVRPRAGEMSTADALAVAAMNGESFEVGARVQDADDLHAALAEKLGVAVTLPQGELVRYVALRSDIAPSAMGVGVAALVNGRRVLLVFERAAGESDAGAPVASRQVAGLHVHERTLGGLRVREWSVGDRPLLLPGVALR